MGAAFPFGEALAKRHREAESKTGLGLQEDRITRVQREDGEVEGQGEGRAAVRPEGFQKSAPFDCPRVDGRLSRLADGAAVKTGTIRMLAVSHERYPNMETSMSIRKVFALSLFAAIALSSAALAQGGGGGGGAGGGGAGGASSGAAGGASGAGGAAGTTGGATTRAPNAGTTTGSGVNSNATGQRPGGNTTNSRDTINNQDRNPQR